jgi:pyruvate ferredoxin oxidoreductase alpha subunit
MPLELVTDCYSATPAPRLLTGGHAVAEAMRQIDPDVVPVYPITPQTPIIQGYAAFVAQGRAHGEMVDVESEHSAMSAAIGSALAGARTITATSSQGLALMAEIVYIAAAMRAPIVVALGNRALSGPINIHCDHSDSMLIRDSGAIQLFAENAQEAYDLMVMAPRLAEHPDVLLPVLVCQDGFTITHSAEPVTLLDDAQVRDFVGDYAVPNALLDVGRPTSQGPFAMPDSYYELRHQQLAAMWTALEVFPEIAAEFADVSGRAYAPIEPYALEDAERAIVCLGSTGGTVKDVVDELRAEGERVGLLQIRSFRPFPREQVRAALGHVRGVAVLDRADSPGGWPPLYAELAAASPAARVAALGQRAAHAAARLAPSLRSGIALAGARLHAALRALHATSPLATLGRGYAIVTRKPDILI